MLGGVAGFAVGGAASSWQDPAEFVNTAWLAVPVRGRTVVKLSCGEVAPERMLKVTPAIRITCHATSGPEPVARAETSPSARRYGLIEGVRRDCAAMEQALNSPQTPPPRRIVRNRHIPYRPNHRALRIWTHSALVTDYSPLREVPESWRSWWLVCAEATRAGTLWRCC